MESIKHLPLLSPHEALLCELARQDVDATKLNDMIGNIRGLQWDDLGKTAFEHKVLPLVRRNAARVVAVDHRPSEEQLQKWDHELASLDQIADALQSYMQQIALAFRQNDIEFIVWKGPAFAEIVYRNEQLRHYYDVDFLVNQSSVMDAHDILMELGFAPEPHGADVEVSREQVAERVHAQNHQFPYIHRANRYFIELHTGLTNQSDVRLSDIRMQESHLYRGVQFPTLAELTVIACLHAYQHLSYNVPLLQDEASRLGHYTDVRESYLRVLAESRMDQLEVCAIEWRCSDLVASMIGVAERLLGDFARPMRGLTVSKACSIWAVDWTSGYLSSPVERRLFDPIGEYESIKILHQKMEVSDDAFNRLRCVSVSDEHARQGERVIWEYLRAERVTRRSIDKSYFWPSHSSARRDIGALLDIPEFLVYWCPSQFTVVAEIVDDGVSGADAMEFHDKEVYLFVRIIHAGRRLDYYVPSSHEGPRVVLRPTSVIPQLPQLRGARGARAIEIGRGRKLLAVHFDWGALGIRPRQGLLLRFDIGLFLSNFLSAFLVYSGCGFDYGFLFGKERSDWVHGRMELI